jgi:hypothetical protein
MRGKASLSLSLSLSLSISLTHFNEKVSRRFSKIGREVTQNYLSFSLIINHCPSLINDCCHKGCFVVIFSIGMKKKMRKQTIDEERRANSQIAFMRLHDNFLSLSFPFLS